MSNTTTTADGQGVRSAEGRDGAELRRPAEHGAVADRSIEAQLDVAASLSRIELWPLSVERWLDRHWWLVFAVPLAFCCWAVSMGAETALLTDPYLVSLVATLVLSTVAFRLWAKEFRTTFANAILDGWIPSTRPSVEKLAAYTRTLRDRLRSQWRYLPIAVSVVFATVATLGDLAVALRLLWSADGGDRAAGLLFAMVWITCAVWAYGMGAVFWCLLVATHWISKVAENLEFQLLPGHPDGCGGVKAVGRCCFGAVVPLLLGAMLALVWSFSRELAFFDRYDPTPYFDFIVPIARAVVVVLVVLGGVLAVNPLRGLHALMASRNADRQRAYVQRLARSVRALESAIQSGQEIAPSVEALKSSRELAPAKLRMSNWPFDHRLVTKYAFMPIVSVLISVAKDALMELF